MRIWFDLDGTLCDTPDDIDHDDAQAILARCTPRPQALAHVKELLRLGHGIGIITGRDELNLRLGRVYVAPNWNGLPEIARKGADRRDEDLPLTYYDPGREIVAFECLAERDDWERREGPP